jgi:serine/threonine-protein kinase
MSQSLSGPNGTVMAKTALAQTAAAPTALAQTAAAPSADAAIVPPAALRATRPSVLPHIERDNAGGLRVVHDGAERYKHVARIGAGGMGEVERAEDRDIGREVAIKRLLPEAANAAGLARFVDEVRIVGSLEHPNVVPVHDVGVDADGRYFFVMKYVEGETLEAIIEKLLARDPETTRAYPVSRRVEVFLDVLKALEYAHAQGVIHRDIKPSNVIVGRYGEVYLMDWGISRRVDAAEHEFVQETKDPSARAQVRTTRHGALIGTPAYMSPEQARGDHDRVDPRSDLYAACVMFHELLSLRYYLDDRCATLPQLLMAIEHVPMPYFGLGQGAPGHPGLPPEYAHFLAKGLQKDPARRWQSAAEMIAELYGILEGKVRVQCVATFSKRVTREAGRFVDRHPIGGFASLVGLALLLLSTVTLSIVGLVRH